MKNRKGVWLAEETGKTIIAVLAIILLAYLLFSLTYRALKGNDFELAKSSLQFLVSEINSGKTKVEIYNPDGWWIGTWTQLQQCTNIGLQNCICICKEKDADSCDKNGICLDNKGFFMEQNPIEIEDPPITLNINQETKKISLEQ